MIYDRLPRPNGLELTREQLRVYMMCNGQRVLDEVGELTRLTASDVLRAVQELHQLNLLVVTASAAQPVTPHTPSSPVGVRPEQMGNTSATPLAGTRDALSVLESALSGALGERAAPFLTQLRACPDDDGVKALVPRMVARLKLTVSKDAGDALHRAFTRAYPS